MEQIPLPIIRVKLLEAIEVANEDQEAISKIQAAAIEEHLTQKTERNNNRDDDQALIA